MNAYGLMMIMSKENAAGTEMNKSKGTDGTLDESQGPIQRAMLVMGPFSCFIKIKNYSLSRIVFNL